MAWSDAQIAALETAIATGLKRIVFMSGDTRREQEFQSASDMQRLLDRMRAERAADLAGGPVGEAVASHSRD